MCGCLAGGGCRCVAHRRDAEMTETSGKLKLVRSRSGGVERSELASGGRGRK